MELASDQFEITVKRKSTQHLMKKYIIFLFAFFAVSTLNAQSKLAHLNSQEVMASMPSYSRAVQNLEAFQYELRSELQEMQADFQAAVQKLQKMMQEGTSPTLIEIQRQKVAKKEQELIEREQSVQTEVEAYSRELNAPIVNRINNAIKTVSDQNGYLYVFDVSTVMYANGKDITKEVIAEVAKLENTPTPQEEIPVTNN